VINAGGVINCACEAAGSTRATAYQHAAGIGVTLTQIFATAARQGCCTGVVAENMARRRLNSGDTKARKNRKGD
jgi:hypothetical protein